MNHKKLLISLILVFSLIASPVFAAIAIDATANGGGTTATSISWSHTTTGSNRILFVGFRFASATNDVTSVTYNGVAMTAITCSAAPQAAQFACLYYLVAPATGLNTATVNLSSSVRVEPVSISYTGASQTGVPDATSVATTTASNSVTATLTTVANNSWVVGYGYSSGATITEGNAGTVVEVRNSNAGFGMIDKNGAVSPVGATSTAITAAGADGTFAGIWSASFAPAAAAVVPVSRRRSIIIYAPELSKIYS